MKDSKKKAATAKPKESLLAKMARERREANASKAAPPVPRTKLKRRPVKVIKEAPLLVVLKELSFHPLLKRVAMLPDLIGRETKLGNAQGKSRGAHKAAAEEMAHDFEALVDSISRYGVRERIKVLQTAKGMQIVDGRHRYEAAKRVAGMRYKDPAREAIARRLEAEGIPCELVREDEVVPIIMDAVTRRHMSKGARAYLAVLMQPEIATEAKRGGDRKSNRTECGLITAEELAARAGVSPRLIEDAVALYKLFDQRKDARAKFEDAIWVGAGLAKLRAGVNGYLTTGQEPDEEPETEEQAKARIAAERVQTAMSRWVDMKTSLKFWDTMKPEARTEIIRHAAAVIGETPEDFRAGLIEAITGPAI